MSDEIEKSIDETPVDDVVFENTEEAGGPEYVEGAEEILSKDKIKKLREELKEAKAKEMEYLTSWQRERADFTNYKKDEIERTARLITLTREKFTEELIPVLDAYDMAFANKEAWEKVDKGWRTGVEYIHAQLIKVLSENSVVEIDCKVGDKLDANIHEPVDNIPTEDESKDHTIAQIIQKGYKSGDHSNISGPGKIIRPARVKIFQK